MADIFLSYKREDGALARRVINALEADGFSAWWDDRISPSEHWDERIEREINAARAVVVLWTPASVASQWVRAEAQLALGAQKLAPLLLAPCTPPLAFTLVQAIDLTRWDGDRTHPAWRKVLAYVSDVIKGGWRDATSEATNTEAPRQDWRAAFGHHVNNEPILLGASIGASAPTGAVFKDGEGLPLMGVIGGGSFVMGAARGAPDSRDNEYPQRRVDVAKFALGVYPITHAEWEVARRDGGVAHAPSDERWGGGAVPVVNVSWNDAQSLVRWLSQRSGARYRLASEAEWEYACRAGGQGAFSFDGAMTTERACFNTARPAPVGSYAANAFGLFDMHGNVREWVEDLWHDSYADAPLDAIPWTTGHSAMRVVRGGAWRDAPWFLRSASRGRAGAGERCNFIGLRVARDI